MFCFILSCAHYYNISVPDWTASYHFVYYIKLIALAFRSSYHGVCRLIQSVSSLWLHLRMPIKGLSETYGGNHYFRQESPKPFSVWRRFYGEAECSRLFLYSIIIIRSALSVHTVQFFMTSALFASPGQRSSRGLSTVVLVGERLSNILWSIKCTK